MQPNHVLAGYLLGRSIRTIDIARDRLQLQFADRSIAFGALPVAVWDGSIVVPSHPDYVTTLHAFQGQAVQRVEYEPRDFLELGFGAHALHVSLIPTDASKRVLEPFTLHVAGRSLVFL